MYKKDDVSVKRGKIEVKSRTNLEEADSIGALIGHIERWVSMNMTEYKSIGQLAKVMC